MGQSKPTITSSHQYPIIPNSIYQSIATQNPSYEQIPINSIAQSNEFDFQMDRYPRFAIKIAIVLQCMSGQQSQLITLMRTLLPSQMHRGLHQP